MPYPIRLLRSPVDEPKRLAPCRILIVEDEEDLRELMLLTLEDADCAARGARTLAEGLSLAISETFDVVLADLSLPGGGGQALLHELRVQGCATPVVFTSGDPDRLAEAARATGCRTLAKPFVLDHLLKIVDALRDGEASV
jgi:DNA-binding NtrC family response regulator